MKPNPAPIIISENCDLKKLVTAIVEDAKRCAARGDLRDQEWLITIGAEWIDVVMDIHPDRVISWARGHKPQPKREADPRRWDKYKPGNRQREFLPG